MELRGAGIVKLIALPDMLAQSVGRREWRVALAVGLALTLTGCGGAKLGDLLKDSPSQEEKP